MFARQIRAMDAKQKIAFGGVFTSLNPSEVKLQCPEVDFVCRGDGEQLILDLMDNLDNPETVARRDLGRAGSEPRSPEHTSSARTRELDQWPFPDRESLPLDFIESMPLDVPAVLSLGRYTTMQASRGCPWPCIFCDIPIFNEGKWRCRGSAHVVAELKHLEENGYESVFFVDDHFLLKPKRIEEMCAGNHRERTEDPVGLRRSC